MKRAELERRRKQTRGGYLFANLSMGGDETKVRLAEKDANIKGKRKLEGRSQEERI